MIQPLESHNVRILMGIFTLLALSLVFSSGCRKYPNCAKDKHCERFEERESHGTPFCVNRICSECRDDSSCAACTECNGGECERIAGCCRSDSDCPSPGRCWVDNRPVQGSELGLCGAQCLSATDCDNGLICEGGLCVEPPECRADNDCASLSRCLNSEGQNQCRCNANNCQFVEPTLCSVDTVYFDFNEDALTRNGQGTLDSNVGCLNGERADQSFTIEGHCDERGTNEYNMALGERRARSVFRYLERNDISDDRMNRISYGETRPSNNGHNESAWSRNRRAAFNMND